MDRLRGLPAVLVMLLGGAAVALAAGAGLYIVRRRRSPEAEWADGVAALAGQQTAKAEAAELDDSTMEGHTQPASSPRLPGRPRPRRH